MNDREKLIELMIKAKKTDPEDKPFSEYLAEFLTANGVVIREKGEWKLESDPINDPKGYFIRIVCPKCGLKTGQTANFCPNCGADMRKGNT